MPQTTRIGLGAAIVAASIALSGCSLLPTTTAPSAPAEETPSAPAAEAFVYEDAVAGFAITFPGEPQVDAISGNENGAQRATFISADGVYYTAGGTAESQNDNTLDSLQDTFFVMDSMGSIKLTDNLIPTETELDGVPALRAAVTMDDGNEGEMVLAGDGPLYYQLLVVGGTTDERDAFFGSFERLD